MDIEERKVPSHELTYAKLRDMILYGHLAPGQPVTIQGLVADLEAGMTPVREAIRRLTAEGALFPQGNRRVSVPPMDGPALKQLAFARLALEPHLAALAMANMSQALIDKLTSLDDQVNEAMAKEDIPSYLQANYAFHFALYEAADAPILLDMVRSLWLRAGPSLREVIGRYGQKGLPDLHAEALSAMHQRDSSRLAAAIARDIEQGIEQIQAALDEE